MECGCLQLNRTAANAESDHAIRYVRRVLLMVSQDGYRILRCRCAVRIRRGAERRFTQWAAVNEQTRALGKAEIVLACNLHQEVMRVLAVHNGQTIRRFAALK